MILSRRAAWFLVGLAVWNVFVWTTFVKNVFPDHHFDGFFLVHLAIGGLSAGLALLAGGIGVRGLRGGRRSTGSRRPAAPPRGPANVTGDPSRSL